MGTSRHGAEAKGWKKFEWVEADDSEDRGECAVSQAELRQVDRNWQQWQQWVQVSLQGEGGGSGALVGHLVAALPGAVCVYSSNPKLGLARAAFGKQHQWAQRWVCRQRATWVGDPTAQLVSAGRHQSSIMRQQPLKLFPVWGLGAGGQYYVQQKLPDKECEY